MKTIKKLTVLFTLISVLSISSCKKDKDFTGSREDIESFLGSDVVEAMDDIGFNMNYGENPPQIEGQFLISPADLLSSTVPDDPETHRFNDLKAIFKNQDNKMLTIDYEGDEMFENSVGKGTFIAGDGEYFTVAMKTETTKTFGGKGESAFIITGKITAEGIEDVEVAAFMIKIITEDLLFPFIPENTGRVIIDGDSLAERL